MSETPKITPETNLDCAGCGHPESCHNSPIANGCCEGMYERCGCRRFAPSSSGESAAAAPSGGQGRPGGFHEERDGALEHLFRAADEWASTPYPLELRPCDRALVQAINRVREFDSPSPAPGSEREALATKWRQVAATHESIAEHWRARSTVENPCAVQVAERLAYAAAYRAAADDLAVAPAPRPEVEEVPEEERARLESLRAQIIEHGEGVETWKARALFTQACLRLMPAILRALRSPQHAQHEEG